MKVQRVEQRALGRADCGVACVAMLAGCRYEDALLALGFEGQQRQCYTRHHHVIRALVKLGCVVQRKKFTTWQQMAGPAIVAVNHTRRGKYWHWVVWAEHTIWDPRPNQLREAHDVRGMRGRGWYVLLIQRDHEDVESLANSKDGQ